MLLSYSVYPPEALPAPLHPLRFTLYLPQEYEIEEYWIFPILLVPCFLCLLSSHLRARDTDLHFSELVRLLR